MALVDSTLRITLVSARVKQWLVDNFETAGGNRAIAQRLAQYIERIMSGNESAFGTGNPPSIAMNIKGNAVPASGTVIFSAAATANDQFIVNGTTFTAVASGATGNQFNVGVSATASATNLKTAINASATALVSSQVLASSSVGTVTITSLDYGVFGNQCTIAKGTDAGSVMTVSGARLTAGAVDATAVTLSF